MFGRRYRPMTLKIRDMTSLCQLIVDLEEMRRDYYSDVLYGVPIRIDTNVALISAESRHKALTNGLAYVEVRLNAQCVKYLTERLVPEVKLEEMYG